MSADTIALDQWQVQFHEVMAALLRVKATIQREAGIIGVAKRLWDVARVLKNLLRLQEHIYQHMLVLPEGTVDEAIIKGSLRSAGELVRSIEDLLDTAKRHGLTNRTLTAGSLEVIRRCGEEIAERLDVLRLSTDPEVEALIRQGREDFAEGRGISLDSLLQG